MDRRRALLAASQTGGGKKVNNIYPIYVEDGPDVALMMTSEYPVTSDVILYDRGSILVGIRNGATQSGKYYSPVDIASAYISPTEDDTYIYNLVKD